MPIAMTVTDSSDGANAVAAITGSGGTDTNTLYKATWSGATGTLTFASAGSRSGDGNITASTGVGYWLWLLESVVVATSVKTVVIVFQNTTTTATAGDPVIYRVMDAIKTQIVALNLSGVTSTNVLIKWLPRQFDTTTDPVPCVIISPAPIPETSPSYLVNTDHVGYPVMVTIIDKQNADFTANLSRNLKWRELLMREFRFQPLDTVAEAVTCVIEPKAIIDPAAFAKNLWVSSMVLRVTARESRGN